MLRGFILGMIAVIALGALGGYLVLKSGMVPANADAQPGGFELWVADTSLSATLTRNAPKGPNPIPLTEANLTQAVTLYGQHCAICHGDSRGDASASPVAKGEYPRPPQFATDGVEDDPEGFSYWKIKHGIRLTGMPAWASTLSDQQIWSLAQLLKHMDKLPPGTQHAWQRVRN